ncbi:MAG: hypothetical protein RLY78_1654 [Pseudomonadota bacterium]
MSYVQSHPQISHTARCARPLGPTLATVATLALSLMLAGCGGGGTGGTSSESSGSGSGSGNSSGDTTAPTETYDLGRALSRLYTHGYTRAGLSTTTAAGVRYTLDLQIDPYQTAEQNGSSYKVSAHYTTIRAADGTVLRLGQTSEVYQDSPSFRSLYRVSPTTVSYHALVESGLPSAALPGSGLNPLMSSTDHLRTADNTAGEQISTSNTFWSLTRVSASTAWFCLTTVTTLSGQSQPSGSTAECLLLDRSADLQVIGARLNLPISDGDGNLTFE